MAFSPVVSASLSGANGGTSSGVDTTGASLIVVSLSFDGGGSGLSVSDNKGNTYTGLTLQVSTGGRSSRKQLFYCQNPTVGTGHTFTIGGVLVFAAANISAWAGAATTGVYDVEDGGTSGAATTNAVGVGTGSGITPTNNNELIVATVEIDNTVTGFTAGTGFNVSNIVQYAGGVNWGDGVVYQIQTTATSIPTSQVVSQWTGAQPITLASAAFVAAVGGSSHATSGALVGSAATIAGTAAHRTLHTTTGALAASAASVAGTAAHRTLHTTTGTLAAGSATVSGTAAHHHKASGALAGQAATIAGTAVHTAATGTHPSSGALAGSAATIAGTATHRTLHTTTGALAASAAVVAGTALHTAPVVKSVTLRLVDKADAGVVMPNLASLRWAWWDTTNPSAFGAPVNQGSTESTDGTGTITVDIPSSSLTSGQVGWLLLTNSDGTTTQNPPCRSFAGPVAVN